jgi:4-aminobutyrate aminotransferase-like enzyme
MSMANAYVPGTANGLSPERLALINRRERVLGPAYRLFYEEPLHFVRGDGPWLFDAEGNAYLDAYNNVASLGHNHPAVTEATARQAQVLNTHTRYLHETILDYAETLLTEFPDELGNVMFTCTGSEANDLALRIAKAHTGGQGFIVTEFAYHGVTDAIAAMSPSLGTGVPLGANVRTVRAPDRYRGDGADVGRRLAADVAAAAADLKASGFRPAALLLDTIFSSDGVHSAPEGFLAPAVDAIHAAGGLFIADEVQPGFGRTGAGFWGFSRHGVVPDIVTLGKPMGNGYPVAGLVARPEVLQGFGKSSRYFNTFGGNPVACAAGLAVLDVIRSEKLIANAAAVGERLRSGIERLAGAHELIGDIRGSGLFLGVELVGDRATKIAALDETTKLVNFMRRRRVLISATGPRQNVLKIRPPLNFTNDNADLLLGVLEEGLVAVRG